jgi:hypothetical protein
MQKVKHNIMKKSILDREQLSYLNNSSQSALRMAVSIPAVYSRGFYESAEWLKCMDRTLK